MPYYATTIITGSTAAAALSGVQPIRRPPDIARAQGDVQTVMGVLTFASGLNLAVNDVIELAILPADHVPLDFVLVTDQFDSNAATTLAGNLGVMSGAVADAARIQTAVGTEFGAAIKWGGTAGSLAKPGYANGGANVLTNAMYATNVLGVAPSSTADRSIGMAITALAATNPATARTLRFAFTFRWSSYGL